MKNFFSFLIGPALLGLWIATNWSPALWIFNGLVLIGGIAVMIAALSIDHLSAAKLNQVLNVYRRTSTFRLMYTFGYQIAVMVLLYSYDLRKSLILFVLSFVAYCFLNSTVYAMERRARI